MSRRLDRHHHRDESSFEEPSLVPMADMLTNTVGIIVFILIFTVLAASGGELIKRLPRERKTEAGPRYYVCTGGKVYRLDDALVDKLIDQFREDNSPPLAEGDTVGRTWTASDDALQLALRFRRQTIKYGSEPERRITRLSVIITPTEDGGEGPSELAKAGSKFRKDLKQTSKDKHFVMMWVQPDGVSAFRSAREIAVAEGFGVGWMPWSGDNKIEFGLGGGPGDGPLPQ